MINWSKLTSPSTNWEDAARKVGDENRKWREANPEAWEEQQAYLAERRYKESLKRRANEDTQQNGDEEITLFDMGYDS